VYGSIIITAWGGDSLYMLYTHCTLRYSDVIPVIPVILAFPDHRSFVLSLKTTSLRDLINNRRLTSNFILFVASPVPFQGIGLQRFICRKSINQSIHFVMKHITCDTAVISLTGTTRLKSTYAKINTKNSLLKYVH